MTIYQICQKLNNYFEDAKWLSTSFIIENGSLDVSGLDVLEGQYVRIVGSVFNDGIYRVEDMQVKDLQDETFNGAVWSLKIPKELEDLVTKINEWETANNSKINSPYVSESFGGYSYTKATGADGGVAGWEDVPEFKSQLARWRKYRCY